MHFFSVGAAIGAAALVGRLVDAEVAWLLGGFLATLLARVGLQRSLGK